MLIPTPARPERGSHVTKVGRTAGTLVLFFAFAGALFAETPLTDQQIATILVQASRDAYYKTGHPCACPEDLARNGSRCGGRSAYSRPGGAAPYCYVTDVKREEIERYRTKLR